MLGVPKWGSDGDQLVNVRQASHFALSSLAWREQGSGETLFDSLAVPALRALQLVSSGEMGRFFR